MSSKPRIVMKFGGSSLADLDQIRLVAKTVVDRSAQASVVVVVSAMGKTTNRLLEEAKTLCDTPPSRELDMLLTTGERHSMALLALAICGLGRRAVSLTGSQCGILTDHQHGRARIMEVRPFRILDELDGGNIVIVGGYQGVSYKREVTTLGRGGTDTTAVAVAAAIGADCEIYSDVDGVYSADPRDVPNATHQHELTYAEAQALSRAGAKVLHEQAVQIAQEKGIAIYARATAGSDKETVIRNNPVRPSGVRAIASDTGIISLRITCSDPRWGTSPQVAGSLGRLGLRFLSVDRGAVHGLLTGSRRTDIDDVLAALGRLTSAVEGLDLIEARDGLALVSCVGSGFEERPELVAEATATLDDHGIVVDQFHTDAHTLAFAIPADARQDAVRALHSRFVEA